MDALDSLIAANARRWSDMKVSPAFAGSIDSAARRLVAARPRYEAVAAKTGVPWDVIAVIHEREASQSWRANIAQGDPWDRVSVHVPAGRGPFPSWEAAAEDALTNCGPYAARWKDWSPGGRLTLLEQYNGLGYFRRGLPSPYIWASTNQYSKGKYVADGKFDPEAVDHQLGCAALLSRIAELSGSAHAASAPKLVPPAKPVPAPAVKPRGLFSLIISLLSRILKGK